jgi:hypothetical protein
MPQASELHHLAPSLAFWHAFDSASKSELFSTAVADETGRLLLIDPIPLSASALASLRPMGSPTAIVVTNSNHARAAEQYSREFNLPVFADPATTAAVSTSFEPVESLGSLISGLSVISIEGAAPGEIALHFRHGNGTVIVGDSLIHFDPYGLALLPKNYCRDQREMRRSLRQLLSCKSSRLLFAHGMPILNQAMSRLESLLHDD